VKAERFIYFFTVSGFFIGLAFSIINFSKPEDLIIYTLEITLFCYLLIHFVIVYFVDADGNLKNIFKKEIYEQDIDNYVYELKEREKKMNSHIKDIETMENKESN